MVSTFKSHYFYLCIMLGIAVGLCFPFIFILLDLKQLGLEITPTNMYEVFKSQNIYTFSSILFPLLFGVIAGLFYRIFSQNNKLAEQESYINNVLNSLVDCILVCDFFGKIQYANRSFYEFYGHDTQSITAFIGIANLGKVTEGQIYDASLINKFHETRSVNYTVSSALTKGLFIISIRDVEELKKNEIIIETQKSQLFEATKLSALGQMASGFAHEINNPLAVINGKLMHIERELKKDDFSKDVIYKNIDVNKKMVMRITKIIKGLRTLSHSSADEQSESITIKDLIEDFINMANLKLTGRDIEFKIDIAKVENELIYCNPIQLSQVFMNLFTNAIDAIEGDGLQWFSLQVEQIENNFKFTVSDSGKGIPLELQKKIFDPMFTTKAIGKGTGLGLSISRAIIEKHDGKITINNESPNTSFEIYIPAKYEIKSVA